MRGGESAASASGAGIALRSPKVAAGRPHHLVYSRWGVLRVGAAGSADVVAGNSGHSVVGDLLAPRLDALLGRLLAPDRVGRGLRPLVSLVLVWAVFQHICWHSR